MIADCFFIDVVVDVAGVVVKEPIGMAKQKRMTSPREDAETHRILAWSVMLGPPFHPPSPPSPPLLWRVDGEIP